MTEREEEIERGYLSAWKAFNGAGADAPVLSFGGAGWWTLRRGGTEFKYRTYQIREMTERLQRWSLGEVGQGPRSWR